MFIEDKYCCFWVHILCAGPAGPPGLAPPHGPTGPAGVAGPNVTSETQSAGFHRRQRLAAESPGESGGGSGVGTQGVLLPSKGPSVLPLSSSKPPLNPPHLPYGPASLPVCSLTFDTEHLLLQGTSFILVFVQINTVPTKLPPTPTLIPPPSR